MLNAYLVNEHYLNYAASIVVVELLHTIINGAYYSRAYPTNAIFLISSDIDGAQIDSEGAEDTEVLRSGERIDFRFVPQVNNQTGLDALVVSLLAQQRLLSKSGSIVVPWNCGQEMHDVIKITDTPCNQADDTLRVMGMRTVYDPKNSTITLNLILGAV